MCQVFTTVLLIQVSHMHIYGEYKEYEECMYVKILLYKDH